MIKDQRDFWAGVVFMAFGAFFCIYSATHYSIGTAARMGPGYFPMLLGGFLFLLGLAVSGKALLIRSSADDGGHIGRFDWFSFTVILGAVCLFAVLLKTAGLLASTAVMVFVSSLANRAFRWKESLVLCFLLSVMVWVIFVYGLNLLVPVWPVFLTL